MATRTKSPSAKKSQLSRDPEGGVATITEEAESMSRTALEKLAVAVEQLQAQVSTLSERLAKLEGTAAPVAAAPAPVPEPVAAPAPAAAAPAEPEEISPEILLAISAAVAAFMGERAHIRAVRLIGTTRWSQEGRVSIQASHRLQRA